jgi:flagellum-specific ATP synthase
MDMKAFIRLDRFHDCLTACNPIQIYGKVSRVVGFTVESIGPECRIGTVCDIFDKDGGRRFPAEVMGFKDNRVLMMPLEEVHGIGPGSRVVARQTQAYIPVGKQLLGRVLDGIGHPIDGKGPIETTEQYPIYAQPLNPLKRKRISQPLDLGIRALNGLLTIGCGQRIGIFAGSGVGKSVLLGMIAKKTRADVNVIALIGERGRELNDFIEKQLGQEGLQRSVIVVATSDHLPLIRMRGAFIATAVAEYFRDQGLKVNLMMDSVTRFAMAQREIGLALGEPPTTKGYTPSVFTLLPKLMERAGTSATRGSITGLYTVLVEGDDTNEPIADAIRSILDGHVVLTRELAMQGHYPAIDISRSISRVMDDIVSEDHRFCARKLKSILATYRRAEDLINIGAYAAGSNPDIDQAIEMIAGINAYLRQDVETTVGLEESIAALTALFE